MTLNNVFNSDKGLIEAPAGCGKTQLIANALAFPANKPYLVLTHTTAGVAALKKRLQEIPSKNYRVTTIAGWALTIARNFPLTCAYSPPLFDSPNYIKLQQSVSNNLFHLNDIIKASYSRLFVDEYQDCSVSQHTLICVLSRCIPTVVFGDPLQAIFGFNKDPLPSWSDDVLSFFPIVASLDTPWRWNNADAPKLGEWILKVREQLLNGNSIDLKSCPDHVRWCQLSKDIRKNIRLQIEALRNICSDITHQEKILVIGNSKYHKSRHNFAKLVNDLDVVEPVDLTDIVSFARQLDELDGERLLELVLELATSVMTNVNKTKLLNRLTSIASGRNSKAPTLIESAAINIIQNKNPKTILHLFKELESNTDTKVYRRNALAALKNLLALSINDPSKSLHESSIVIREQRRHNGDERISQYAIGSTLLLKGLEADHVLILNADNIDKQNLYVALSRATKSITILSQSHIIHF